MITVHHIPITCLRFTHVTLLYTQNFMNKQDLITKYKPQLILNNDSEHTIQSYHSCVRLFLNYISENKLNKITLDNVLFGVYKCGLT